MGLLDNKICVVTGGAGSVGLASAKAFVREGGKVMIVDLKAEDAARAAKEINSPNVASCGADVSSAADTKAYLSATVAKWGKIDVLFSNAGNPGQAAPLTDYPEDVFDRTLAIHAKGAFLACKYGLPQMNDGGSIIITSSL
ncbi:MAG: SDR family NAD(P)-dependent oxidoreductase, partial [Xanthobacteraceae bacterium]